MSLFRTHTLEVWEVSCTCCDTPSLLSLCSILSSLPSTMARFSDLPFFLPTYCSSSFYRPGAASFVISSMCLGGPGSRRVHYPSLHPWLYPSGQKCCATHSCREVWLRMSLPPPPQHGLQAWAPRSSSFPSNIFLSCCQTHLERGMTQLCSVGFQH